MALNYPQIVLFVLAAYLLLQFFDQIAKALLLFLAAFLIAVVLNAPVRWLENRGVRRSVSAAGVALLVLGGIGAAAYLAGPPLAEEAAQLVQEAPDRVDRLRAQTDRFATQYPALRSLLNSDALESENILKQVQGLLPRLGRYTLGFLGAFASGFFVFVIALYTLGSPHSLLRGVIAAVPPGYRRPATRALTRIVGQLEAWASATLLLMVIVGTLSGIGLWLLKVPNAVLFGVLAGIGEGIPTIGPILSAIPPIVVSLADDPTKALWVAVLFLVIQQVENNVLVPLIMGRSLKLHPVSILFFVLALSAVLGLAGALLAVPSAIITKVAWEEFYLRGRRPSAGVLTQAAEQILRAGSRPGRDTAPRPPGVDSPRLHGE
ncbi:MAG: AI-2E family transporter [Cytophagales bacterium]|nr:AI-2E family transporter [Armatimonadota bacterium]